MANLKLSAFADEYTDGFAEQLLAMREFGITHIELRHADKKNVSVLTADEVKELEIMSKDDVASCIVDEILRKM